VARAPSALPWFHVDDRLVVAVPHDPAWARRFTEEAALLTPVLAPWLDGGIHHVGSTSVPGLAAKPIIDMIAGVRDRTEARAAVAPLSALEYRHQEHRPEAHSFHKPARVAGWWEETHHLHLTEPGSDIWRERLAFRDALRADPELVEEYARWKMENAARLRPGNAYLADKDPFVRRVLAARGIELKPTEERLAGGAVERRRAAAIRRP
jgi:GrpB-like predicted nucleotidyltransferase (UPF0157 family)